LSYVAETSYRGRRIAIAVEHDRLHLVVTALVTGSQDSPFLRMESTVTAVGITADLAREVAMATAVRWIDAILPNGAR
jgi:hypothetical protein